MGHVINEIREIIVPSEPRRYVRLLTPNHRALRSKQVRAAFRIRNVDLAFPSGDQLRLPTSSAEFTLQVQSGWAGFLLRLLDSNGRMVGSWLLANRRTRRRLSGTPTR